MLRASAEYDDPEDKTHRTAHELLLSPYEAQAEEERRAAQKARARQKPEQGGEPEG